MAQDAWRRGPAAGELSGGAPVTKIDAGANGGRGSESGGEPGPKTKLRRRISVAVVRQGEMAA